MEKNLIAHLKTLKEDEKALVVGNQAAFKKYQNALKAFKSQLVLIDIDNQKILYESEYNLVIVVGEDIRKASLYYSKCNEFKRKGIPVVFGIAERALIYEAPNWKSVDLTIGGMFYLASGYIPTLPRKGAYLEFGVFDGRSFTLACHSLKNVCSAFYAFDSFQGIVGAGANEKQLYRDMEYFANIETFWHNMNVSGVSEQPIKVVQGPFQETLNGKTALDYDIDSISVVHIDSDIYEAAILALEFVSPCLIDGALILFDEFHAFGASNNKGERRAFREWLDRHHEFSAEIYRNYTSVARSYIIHRSPENELVEI